MSFSKVKKRNLIAGAMLPLSLAVSTPTFAQDGAEEIEEVVVTGIRKGIRDAIAIKRNETSIVEAISAEDIGKLPDISIAESIARLPGLAAQRLRGRAQVISVRGLGPDFTTALLNGREQVTAGDNRGVEFDQYPSELLSGVVVYKTPDASLIGQGLAGTADLRTIRPLEYGQKTTALNARYEWNGDGALNAGSDDTGYRLTGIYVNQFADETVGVLLGLASQSSPTQAERWDAWGYPTVSDGGPLVIGGAKPYVESRELERDAIVGTLQYQPNDNVDVTVDAFYSEFEDNGILRGIELPLQWGNSPVAPGFTESDGLVTGGTFQDVKGVIRNDTRFREAEVLSLGLNGKYRISDRWEIEGDASLSKVSRRDTDLETYTGTAAGEANGARENLPFNIADGGGFVFQSGLDYSDPNLVSFTDPRGWGQVGFIKSPVTDDELTALRLSASREVSELGWISDVEFGVNSSTRDKSKRSFESFIDLASPAADGTTAVPANFLLESTQLDFLGLGGVVSYDPLAILNSGGVYSLRTNNNADVITKRWNVSEDVTTAYVQANIQADWGNIPVRGNLGVQVVNTDQSSTGPSISSEGLFEYTDGDDYTEVLPSVNLIFDVTDNGSVRTSVARTLMRARMDDLRASQTLDFNSNICAFNPDGTVTYDPTVETDGSRCLAASGGAPRLRPYLANAFDVSYEHYFADRAGYVSAALFYKDIEDYVDGTDTKPTDFTGLANLIFGEAFVSANPGIAQGTLSQPQNTNGGDISGFEVAASLPGELLTPSLEGFGLYASFSYTDSEVQPNPDEPPRQIPGLSREVANAAVFYENYGFQARVSYRYRSEFLGEVTGFGANREFRQVNGESIFDAQLGYTLQGGPLEGTTFLLQGYNLTDEEFSTFVNDDARQVKDFQSYGRTFLFGVNYKF